MNKKEFIDWIKSLGFSRTWHHNESGETNTHEYSIFPKGELSNPLSSPKLYFVIDDDVFRIYYSDFSNNMSFGSNIGRFPLSSIGDYERFLIVNKLSEYFTELPNGFKEFLRDTKLKNILRD